MQLGIEEEVEEKEKDLLSDEEGMKLDKPDDDEDEDEDEDEDDDTSEDERESEAEIQRLEEQVTWNDYLRAWFDRHNTELFKV